MAAHLRLAALAIVCTGTLAGTAAAQTRSPQAWTLEEVQAQLGLYPHDPYLQYVLVQLARNRGEPELQRAWQQLAQINGRNRFDRQQGVDLFSMFSGKLAIQESLQLDALIPRNLRGEEEKVDRSAKMVPLSELSGPTIKSHPWHEMLAGREPDVSPLALAVPHDQYFVRFKSLPKLLEVLEASNLYERYLYHQAYHEASSNQLEARLRRQLAVDTDPLSRPFYDLVVDEVAVTGSDLFVSEGSDVTLLFRVKQPAVFRARMDLFLLNAAQVPGAKRSEGKLLDVAYTKVATPDRRVSVYSAYPRPELHVRSNSLVGLERALAAIAGKDADGQAVTRLGETDEFRYIRTLMPLGDPQEDGFVYFSDPFIRHMVGPRLKLTERRRMLEYNQLRMIGHAALLYRTQFGQEAKSLEQLAAGKCAPGVFGQGAWQTDGGGDFLLASNRTATSVQWGTPEFLTPCCEVPLDEVTADEAAQYREFLEEYNRYWRAYFDPIALRVQVTPKRYRLETIVLPLIDNSIYTGMASALGGTPEPLDALPVPSRNMFSVNVRLNKEALLEQGGDAIRTLPFMFRDFGIDGDKLTAEEVQSFLAKGIGAQIGVHVYDGPRTFDFNVPGFMGQMMGSFNGRSRVFDNDMLPISLLVTSLNAPVYLSIPVQDEATVDRFLNSLDDVLAVASRQVPRGGWFAVGQDFYRMPAADGLPQIRCHSLQLGPVKWRFFWARIDNGLYIASKKFILEDLAAAHARRKKQGDGLLAPSQGPTGHAMVRFRPSHFKEVLPDFQLSWAENNRHACLNNLGPLSSVARALASGEQAPNKVDAQARMAEIEDRAYEVYGVRYFCPEGGTFQLGPDHQTVHSSVFGTPAAPTQPAAPSAKSAIGQLLNDLWQVTVSLTFTKEGLRGVLEIDRSAK